MSIFCIKCRSAKVTEIVEENQVLYLCLDCNEKSGRAFIVDSKIKMINTTRGVKHISAAALIIKDHRLLLCERRTYPFGLEIPVGHLEYGETLEQAVRREVYEEVGIKVISENLVSQMEQPVSYCRYGSDVEEWAIFSVDFNDFNDFVSNSEFETIEWIPLDCIPANRLTPQTHFALKSLGYIRD